MSEIVINPGDHGKSVALEHAEMLVEDHVLVCYTTQLCVWPVLYM